MRIVLLNFLQNYFQTVDVGQCNDKLLKAILDLAFIYINSLKSGQKGSIDDKLLELTGLYFEIFKEN